MGRFRVVLCVFLAALALASCGTSAAHPAAAGPRSSSPGAAARHPRVGIFLLDDSAFVAPVIAGFKAGFLQASGLKSGDVTWDVQNAADNETLVTSIARRFAASSDNVVAVLGTPAVIAMAQVDQKSPPMVAIAMGDPVGAHVAHSLTKPGTNVTGTTDFIPPARLLSVLMQSRPRPTTLGTVYDSSNENMTVWIADLRAALRSMPHPPALKAVPVDGVDQVAPAVSSLTGRVSALLIGPDAVVAGDALPAVARAALVARIPLYIAGGSLTAKGITGTIGANYVQLGQQSGRLAAKIFKGTDPAVTAFVGPQQLEIALSRSSLKADNVGFPAALMHTAQLGP
jgi:putative ABC transport system substrate-binding protein